MKENEILVKRMVAELDFLSIPFPFPDPINIK